MTPERERGLRIQSGFDLQEGNYQLSDMFAALDAERFLVETLRKERDEARQQTKCAVSLSENAWAPFVLWLVFLGLAIYVSLTVMRMAR